MAHISERDRLAKLQSLPISAEAKAFLETLDAPGGMRELFRQPYSFYSQGWPEQPGDWPSFGDRVLLPLWESGEQVFAADISRPVPEYLRFYVEAPEEYRSFSSSILRAFFYLVELHVWEYGGGPTEVAESLEFAHRLQFPREDEMRKIIKDPACPQATVNDYVATLQHAG